MKLLEDLEWSKVWVESVKQTLMDYVSGGQYQDDIIDRRLKLERMRWERDYWAFRVQCLQGELELMKGDASGESTESGHHGTSCGQDTSPGTGPGVGSLHEGGMDGGDEGPADVLDYRIP